MHKNRRRAAILAIGLLLAVGLVVLGAVASAFAFRQVGERGESRVTLSLSDNLRGGALIQDEPRIESGVLVLDVDEQGPAQAAGIRQGTIILKVEGVDVNSVAELREAIGQHEAGESITITVLNGDEQEEIEVTLESAGPYLGVTVGGDEIGRFGREHFGAIPDLPPDAFPRGNPGRRGLPDTFPGSPGQLLGPVIVLRVEPNSPAEEAGLEPGDLLTEFDSQAIESREGFVEQVGAAEPGETVTLTVHRGAETLVVSATLESHPDDAERGYLGINIGPHAFGREFFGEPGFHGEFFDRFSDQRRG